MFDSIKNVFEQSIGGPSRCELFAQTGLVAAIAKGPRGFPHRGHTHSPGPTAAKAETKRSAATSWSGV